ncbi:MAG: element excision factor XisH family protein [Aphanizomenon sp.]|nr:element excision factor XisH family protein [Nostocales cyanobacterium LE14-WE12]
MEKEGQKIAIEIKSFLNPSKITELYAALGQFIIYGLALQEQEPERTLYLAVPITVYNEFSILPFIQAVIGLTQDSWNNEPLQAQRSRRNEDLRDILRKS